MRFILTFVVALTLSSVANAQCQDGECRLVESVRTIIKKVAQPIPEVVQRRGLVKRLVRRVRRCR